MVDSTSRRISDCAGHDDQLRRTRRKAPTGEIPKASLEREARALEQSFDFISQIVTLRDRDLVTRHPLSRHVHVVDVEAVPSAAHPGALEHVPGLARARTEAER